MKYLYKNIILIDDDPIHNLVFKKLNYASNFAENIRIFENALYALEYLKSLYDEPNLLPNAIFLDIEMPLMNGIEFLELFRLLPNYISKKTSIYIATSSNRNVVDSQLQDFSFVKKIYSKPIGLKQLKDFKY